MDSAPQSSPAPRPSPSVPPPSEEDLAHLRLLSLGIPAFREGIKFEVELRRKRGRPPAERLTVQQLKDKQVIDALYAAPAGVTPEREAGIPPRYTKRARLSLSEIHTLRPLPWPLATSTLDPSAPTVRPSERWAQLARTLSFS